MLHKTFNYVVGTVSPVPPPLGIVEDKEAPTFAVNLSKMLVQAPTYWSKITHLKELLAHEVKHSSSDGLPYTYRNALRFEAEVMKELGVPLKIARTLLNTVYDAVVDTRIMKEGFDAKGMTKEWLQRFPITVEAEGTSYHLLQILYKDLFGSPLRETEYEKEIKNNPLFKRLKGIIKSLVVEGEKFTEEKNVRMVVEAVTIVKNLSRPESPPTSGGKVDVENGDVVFDRNDPAVRVDAAEIGIDTELDREQLAQLMGVGENALDEALGEAAGDKAREALWGKILGFKEIFAGSSMFEVKEPVLERWKPYSRKIDPVSVVKNPQDPRKWKTTTLKTVLTVEQEGEAGGFTKVILLVDVSGSTGAKYAGRSILSFIKDAAYGLIAYARRLRLPIVTVAFSSSAHLIAKESKTYVEHAKKLFMLRSMTSTNLDEAVRLVGRLKPERALIALLTDGLVSQKDLEELAEKSRANRVVAAVVDASKEGVEAVKKMGERVQLFVVKPSEAGRTIVSALPWGNVRAS